MRIIYINSFYDPYIPGGAEITLKNLAEGMQNKRHEVMIITLWEGKNIKEDYINNIKVVRLPIKNIYFPFKLRPNVLKRNLWHLIEVYNPFVINNLKSIIDYFKPDIISVHNTQGWSAPVLWKFLKRNEFPFIQVLHDQYLLCPTNMFKNNQICQQQCNVCKTLRFMYKKNSNFVTGAVGVSKFILNRLKSYGYFKNAKFNEVIYNSRNIANFKYNLNYRKKVNKDIIFGFIGTLAPNKGIELLLKVFNENKKSNWKLLVAGDGNKEYVKYLKDKYKNSNIKFLGKIHPDQFYPYIDCNIVPSLWEENFPGVIIESFIFGKPVIGSKIGGIPEMINNNNGYIFAYSDENDLYKKMIDFEKNIHIWKEKSLEIQNEAIEKYDYKKWLDKWENFYKKVIK